MPTLTASSRARAAAVQRGLASPHIEANRTPVSEVRTSGEPKSGLTETKTPSDLRTEPSNKQRKRTEFLQRQRQARDHLWPLLSARFPLAFCLPAKPLAIGIHRAILEYPEISGDPRELSTFMRYWCSRHSYLRAIHRGDPRRNLDGSVAGIPTVAERNIAGRYLWGPGFVEIKKDGDAGNPAPSHIILSD